MQKTYDPQKNPFARFLSQLLRNQGQILANRLNRSVTINRPMSLQDLLQVQQRQMKSHDPSQSPPAMSLDVAYARTIAHPQDLKAWADLMEATARGAMRNGFWPHELAWRYEENLKEKK